MENRSKLDRGSWFFTLRRFNVNGSPMPYLQVCAYEEDYRPSILLDFSLVRPSPAATTAVKTTVIVFLESVEIPSPSAATDKLTQLV